MSQKCPLCGKEFGDDQLACAACPIHSGCGLLRCPNCGFEFPKESKIVKLFTKIFGKKEQKNDEQGS